MYIKENKNNTNIVNNFKIYNKDLKSFKYYKGKNKKIKNSNFTINLRGKLMGYLKKSNRYEKYVNDFLFPKNTISLIMKKFFKRKFLKKYHYFVIDKYKDFFPLFHKSMILKKIIFFLKKKRKNLKFLKLKLYQISKVNFDYFKTKLKFSLKNFYEFYILKLFSNLNFKFFFFKLLEKINKYLDVKDKYLFLKYEFFGHSYFKRKLFFILKFKLLNFFFSFTKQKELKSVIFQNKINILKKVKYNFSFLKNWLLNFFLNKYNFVNYESQKDFNLKQKISLDLRKIFYLYFSIFDKNLKFFIFSNKKFTNWLYYNINRKKQKIKNLFDIFGYEDDFYYASEDFNKKFLFNLYKSLIFLQLSIKLNNVFVTLSNIKGKVLFKYSTGFYGLRGRKKRDPLTLYNITSNVAKRLKKFEKLNLILKIKKKFKSKYYRQVLNSLKKNKIIPLCYFFIVNREISKRRLKKARRL